MKVKELLTKLVLLDVNSADFIETSKKLVEAVKAESLERKAKKEQEKKEPKEKKAPKSELCQKCYNLLEGKLSEIVPKEKNI